MVGKMVQMLDLKLYILCHSAHLWYSQTLAYFHRFFNINIIKHVNSEWIQPKNYLSFSVCISSFCAVLFLPRRYGPQTPFVCTRWRTKLFVSFICLDNYILSRILKGKAAVFRIWIRIRLIQMFFSLLDYGSIDQKNLDLWLLFDFLSLKNYVNAPPK